MEIKNRLLRIAEVAQITSLSKNTIWLKVSQSQFPKSAKLSTSITVWRESDIWQWINNHF